MQDHVYEHNPQYQKLREQGRQLMQVDPSKVALVQGCLGNVEHQWESLQGGVTEKLQNYTSVSGQWSQYLQTKQQVDKVLDDVQPVVDTPLAFSNQAEVKKVMEKCKVSKNG